MSNLVLPNLPGLLVEENEPTYKTLVYENPGGTEQRVSLMATARHPYRLRGTLRENVAAPSPFQALSEMDLLRMFLDTHKGALDSFLWSDPRQAWRSNLFPYSEPLVANVSKTAGVTQGALTDGGLSNGMIFPAVAQDDFATESVTTVIGTSYVVSAFVKMTDGNPPVPSLTRSSGDFQLMSDNASTGYGNLLTTDLGGGLYRCSMSRTATTGGAQAAGVFRSLNQSGRGFTTSGWQIEIGTVPTSYTKTTGAAYSSQKRVRFEADSLSIRPSEADRWYDVEFNLVSVAT